MASRFLDVKNSNNNVIAKDGFFLPTKRHTAGSNNGEAKMTPYQAAEFLQSAFSFNDDNEAIFYNRARLQPILGDDYIVPGFRDYADIDANVSGFYKAVRNLAEKRFGKLPF